MSAIGIVLLCFSAVCFLLAAYWLGYGHGVQWNLKQ